MANWAKSQEQLTGLPVVKRARNSIHFDKGNGEIVANFSGAPCHYEENGEWKPIDTKLLLLPDGFYGCPHSDVKIHKDGRVKAGGYQQKSTLVDAKEGIVDGDRIVREFKFGTQYLYMKEDGFRQETVITRPPTTAETKYLIASESGELPSKYKRSDITAVDADGAVHEFVNLGQFKKWLDAAAYPVTIDPDFTGTPTKDTLIRISNPNDNFSTSTELYVGKGSNNYQLYRSLLRFDLSSISSAAIVSSSSLSLHCHNGATSSNVSVYRQLKNWVASEATWNSYSTGNSWTTAGGFSASDCEQTDIGSTAMGDVGTYQITITSSKVQEWIDGTLTNNGILLRDPEDTNSTFKRYGSSENATESYRPVLSVTYTAGSTGVPKHFLHYARLRSN